MAYSGKRSGGTRTSGAVSADEARETEQVLSSGRLLFLDAKSVLQKQSWEEGGKTPIRLENGVTLTPHCDLSSRPEEVDGFYAWNLANGHLKVNGAEIKLPGQYSVSILLKWRKENDNYRIPLRAVSEDRDGWCVTNRGSNHLGVLSGRSSGGSYFADSGHEVDSDEWQLVVITGHGDYDEAPEGHSTFYVGTTLSKIAEVGTCERVASGTRLGYFGFFNYGPGLVSEVMIWDRVVTPHEMDRLWNKHFREKHEKAIMKVPATKSAYLQKWHQNAEAYDFRKRYWSSGKKRRHSSSYAPPMDGEAEMEYPRTDHNARIRKKIHVCRVELSNKMNLVLRLRKQEAAEEKSDNDSHVVALKKEIEGMKDDIKRIESIRYYIQQHARQDHKIHVPSLENLQKLCQTTFSKLNDALRQAEGRDTGDSPYPWEVGNKISLLTRVQAGSVIYAAGELGQVVDIQETAASRLLVVQFEDLETEDRAQGQHVQVPVAQAMPVARDAEEIIRNKEAMPCNDLNDYQKGMKVQTPNGYGIVDCPPTDRVTVRMLDASDHITAQRRSYEPKELAIIAVDVGRLIVTGIDALLSSARRSAMNLEEQLSKHVFQRQGCSYSWFPECACVEVTLPEPMPLHEVEELGLKLRKLMEQELKNKSDNNLKLSRNIQAAYEKAKHVSEVLTTQRFDLDAEKKVRLEWRLNSGIEVFSLTKKNWYKGFVYQVSRDKMNHQLLHVQYALEMGEIRRKALPSSDAFLRPLEEDRQKMREELNEADGIQSYNADAPPARYSADAPLQQHPQQATMHPQAAGLAHRNIQVLQPAQSHTQHPPRPGLGRLLSTTSQVVQQPHRPGVERGTAASEAGGDTYGANRGGQRLATAAPGPRGSPADTIGSGRSNNVPLDARAERESLLARNQAPRDSIRLAGDGPLVDTNS